MKKGLLKSGLLLSGALLSQALTAQTDVTELYLTNPSFEVDGDVYNPDRPTGWNHTDNNYGWCGVNTDGDPATKNGNYIFGIWGNKINDFELYQVIPDLEPGIYSISCDIMVAANDNGSRLSTQRVFAGNDEIGYKSQYFGAKGDYAAVNLSKDESYSFAGNKETMGDASALQTTTVILEFPGGDLKIGFRTNGTASAGYEFTENSWGGVGWFKIDNFKMHSYSEDEKIVFHKATLRDVIGNLQGMNYDLFPLGYEEEAGFLVIKAQRLIANSEDENEVLAMIDEINAMIVVLEDSHKSWKRLNGAIEAAKSELAQGYNGADEFSAKLDEALAVFDSFEALKNDFELAADILEVALFDYRSNAVATSEKPLDYTWRISAPFFTNNYESTSDESERSMGRWETEIISNGGDYKLATNTSLNCWNSWSGDFTYMSIYQDLENLPEGLYSLSCLTATDGDVTNQHAYAMSSVNTAVSNPPSADNKTTTGSFKENAIWERIETSQVLVGPDGKLRIGMRSEGGNWIHGWFCCTDFQLVYYGNENALQNYDEALSNLIVQAQELLSDDILKTDAQILNEALNAAISSSRDNIDQIRETISDLTVNIEYAKESIKTLASFKVDVMEKVYGIDPYDTALGILTDNVKLNTEELLESDDLLLSELEELSATLLNFVEFCGKYENALNEIDDEDYSIENVETFYNELERIIETLMPANLENLPKAESDLYYAQLNLRNTKLAEDKDLSSWIVNPGFENSLNGWVNNGMQRQTNSAFEEKTGTAYCEKWVGSGNLDDAYIYQTIIVPPGSYVVSVNASATQYDDPEIEGAYLAACAGDWNTDNAVKVNINGQYIKPAEYAMTEDGEPELDEYGEKILISPAELRYSLEIDALNGKLSVGVYTENTNCNYLRFDDFELHYKGIPASIESTKDIADDVIVYSHNGEIKVIGADSFKVYTIGGQAVNSNAKLQTGIYIVVANGRTYKIAVK